MALTLVLSRSGTAVRLNVKDYGATGDGTTDDTTAIQAAITDCAIGGTVEFPAGTYKITSAITVDKSLVLKGAGVATVETGAGGGNGPTASPYLRGSVLLASTAAQNGIEITGTGANVSIRDLGIRFADAIAFLNTGHGVFAQAATVGAGGHEITVMNGSWENVFVYGHDGNHYAFWLLNSMLSTFTNLRGFGGGGLHIECDSHQTLTGNSVFVHPYFWVFAGGTAKGYDLVGRVGVTGSGKLVHLDFERPQVNVTDVPSYASGRGISSASTMTHWDTTGVVQNVTVHMPDFEQQISGGAFVVNFYDGDQAFTVNRAGGFIKTTVPYSTRFPTYSIQPTLTPGTGLGTGGAASVDSTSDEESGVLTLNCGTSPAAANSDLVQIVPSLCYGWTSMVFQPSSTAAADLNFYVVRITKLDWRLRCRSALAASTNYALNYQFAKYLR